MKIKTICCSMDSGNIYVSDQLWRNPKYAVREGKLTFVGDKGWYANAKMKELYLLLDKEFEVSKFWPGDFMEVDFDFDMENNNA
jgi:hypothetical protein